MNKKPRGIEETTIMQHTFRYAKVDECFKKFRLVCKSWKNAVETMRFNRPVPERYLKHFSWNPGHHPQISPEWVAKHFRDRVTYRAKYLQAFRKLHLDWEYLYEMSEDQRNLISNLTKLNEIKFPFTEFELSEVSPEYYFMMTKMLQNSKTTLQTVQLYNLTIAKDIIFPKLRKLDLLISEHRTSFQDFEKYFRQILEKNMENVEIVVLRLGKMETQHVCEYVSTNYPNHCISFYVPTFSDLPIDVFEILPSKIVEMSALKLLELENKRHTPTIEYLCLNNLPYKAGRERLLLTTGWNRYQDIFDQCTNLKAIELRSWDKEILSDNLYKLTAENQQFWKNVITYFKKRGIHLAKLGENW
jgi:hypothetical protein